ncbi:hypothetical protein ES703_111868 [subsurface metagenome]
MQRFRALAQGSYANGYKGIKQKMLIQDDSPKFLGEGKAVKRLIYYSCSPITDELFHFLAVVTVGKQVLAADNSSTV